MASQGAGDARYRSTSYTSVCEWTDNAADSVSREAYTKRVMKNASHSPIKSDALKANLLETAVAEVVVDPAFDLLYEIVKDYKGIRGSLDGLLHEISHPFHNWKLILPRYRAFVLKNCGYYLNHEKGPRAFSLFSGIFFSAITDAKKNETLLSAAMEALVAYLEKIAGSLAPAQLGRYDAALADCFSRLRSLDDQALLLLVQGHHPMKRIAALLLEKYDQLKRAEKQEVDLDPLFQLMLRIFARNYQYWLKRGRSVSLAGVRVRHHVRRLRGGGAVPRHLPRQPAKAPGKPSKK